MVSLACSSYGKRTKSCLLWALLFSAWPCLGMNFSPGMPLWVAAGGKKSSGGESKEMRTLKLRLEEAKLQVAESKARFEKAEASLKEAQSLFEQGLYNKQELGRAEEEHNKARLERDQAAINLEKTKLAFLSDASHLVLEKAALYRDLEGRKHVSLTLRNGSHTGKIIDEENSYSEGSKKGLLRIEDLRVRVLSEGKLIGRPFEYRIPGLSYNEQKTVDFLLQKDVDAVTVSMAYGDTLVELPVFLETEASEDQVSLEAIQFSQEGELGSKIHFDLELERLADDNSTFGLEALNLPKEYSYEFTSKEGENREEESRVSRIRFKKGVTQKTIRFSVNIPSELPKEALNQKLPLFALVLDRFATQRLAKLKEQSQGRPLTAAELDSAKLSYEALELIPRGRAELTLNATNLYQEIKLGEPVLFNFKVSNNGTVGLELIRVKLGLPLDWSASITPEKDISLGVQQEKNIKVEVIPAPDVVVGDYEVKLETYTQHEGREIKAEPKTLRVQVEGKSNFLLGTLLMVVLVGLVVGVAIMTIRISRR